MYANSIQSTMYCTVFHCSVDETRKAENSQEKCQVELTEPTPTPRPVTTKLLTGMKKVLIASYFKPYTKVFANCENFCQF